MTVAKRPPAEMLLIHIVNARLLGYTLTVEDILQMALTLDVIDDAKLTYLRTTSVADLAEIITAENLP